MWYLFPHGHGSEVNRILSLLLAKYYLILRHTAYQTLFPSYDGGYIIPIYKLGGSMHFCVDPLITIGTFARPFKNIKKTLYSQ